MQNKKLAVAIQSAILTFAVGSVTAEPNDDTMTPTLYGVVELELSNDDGKSDDKKSDDKKSDDKKSDDKKSDDKKSDDKKSDDKKSDDKKSDDKKSDDKKSDDKKSDDKKSDDKKSDDKKSDDKKSDDKKSDDDKSGDTIGIEIIYEIGNPTTDELGNSETTDDDTIDFSELDIESIAELSIDIIANLTVEEFALISLDALLGLTVEQIAALDVSIWESMTAEQLAQIAVSLTADSFVELNQDVLNIVGFNLLMAFERDTVKDVLLMVEESAAWEWMSSDTNVLGWVVLNHNDIIDASLDIFMPVGWSVVVDGEELKFEIEETVVPTLSIELIESMTVNNFALIDESVIDFMKVEQVEVIPTTTLVELDETYLTKFTESDKELSDDFLTRMIVNFDVVKLESKYKKKHDKQYAKELEKFYKRMLPKGWKVDVKIKGSETSIKIKPPKKALKTDIFLHNLSPKFMSAIEFEDDSDYNSVIASMFDYSDVISDDMIVFAEEQPIANRINISFNLINKGNTAKIHQVVPHGWTFNSKTKYINMTSDAVAQMTPDVIVNLNAEQMVRFEPQVFSHFTFEQVTNMPVVALKKLNRKQMAKLSVKSCGGFTKQHFASFDIDALGGMTVEHFNEVSPEALTGITVNNVGGLDSKVIFAMGLDILKGMESTAKLSFADSIKIFSNLNVESVQATEVEKFLHQDIELDITTKKLKLKKGKLKLPKAKKVVLSNMIMPELSDLNVSLNLGGAFAEQTVLTDLTNVLALPKINFPDFSFEQSETGIVKVRGSGTGIELAFRAAVIEQLDEGTDPDLGMNVEGNYALTTEEGQQVTFTPMPKDPELLADVVPDGEVEINENGEVTIDLDTEDETAEKLAGIFDPEVKQAESGLNEGINIEGTGVNQIVKIVYKDGTMQTMLPAIQERISVDYAGPIAAEEPGLTFIYHSNGQVSYNIDGIKWRAKPELKVTKVKVNLTKPVIKILQPGKLVELTTVKGFRQLIHIEQTD
ncbi:hypothetical protein QUF74_02120 [Candidatus Halobeggiatoa sp. HSG11]|nr:hypothetical protein [Candidatus Halobeggiatoa sp. HSG11]